VANTGSMEQKYLCTSTKIINIETNEISIYQTMEQALQTPLRFYITDNGLKLITDADANKYREYYKHKDSKLKLIYENNYQLIMIIEADEKEKFLLISIPKDIKELEGLGFIYENCIRTDSWTLHND
jgi:hypothetical protein